MNEMSMFDKYCIERIRMIRNQGEDISWKDACEMFLNAIKSDEFIELAIKKGA